LADSFHALECGKGDVEMAIRRSLKASHGLAQHLPSAVVKRSVVVAGHKTSVTLEDAFWTVLKDIARSRDMTLSAIIGQIDHEPHSGNLSSTIRLFVLEEARARQQASRMPPAQAITS
jgi:predicted DNA-binding ribbon-helix-helix protein